MAKSKRKPSNAQRDKSNVDAAKRLKAMGLLSKQTKLHSGKYISRGALKKVKALDWVVKNNYAAVPVSKDYAGKATGQGMTLARQGRKDFVIVPKSKSGIEVKRAKAGIISGVVPVPGGQIYSVVLPYDNMTDFTRAVERGDIEKFRSPQEEFAFNYFGFQSRRSFKGLADLREWLNRYDFMDWIGDADMGSELERSWAHFTLYRMLPGVWNPNDFNQRRAAKKGKQRMYQQQQDRRIEGRRNKRIDEISASAAERRREADRKRKAQARATLKATNPQAYKVMLQGNAERSVKSRDKRKAKKDA